MTKTTKELVWRLPEKPRAHEVKELVESEVITKDEARQILFSERDKIKQGEFQEVKRELELIRQILQDTIQPNDLSHLESIVSQPFVNDIWAEWFRSARPLISNQ